MEGEVGEGMSMRGSIVGVARESERRRIIWKGSLGRKFENCFV